jgi:hypothetical protein
VAGGSRGGVYTGPRGTTVVAGGAAGSVTGPRGNTASGAKGGAAVVGPNGNAAATGGKAASVTGPNGSAVAGARGSAAVGPNGAAKSVTRAGAATGPGGTISGISHGAAAVGPNGAVAAGGRHGTATGPGGTVTGGSRVGVATGRGGTVAGGTRWVGGANLAGQGAYVRSGFRYNNTFNRGWYAQHPGAWAAAGWLAGSIWSGASWGSCASTCGYAESTTPYVYDYGENITYQDGSVYYGDQVYATEAQYAEQAQQYADAGRVAQPPEDEKWQPLGVFALVFGDETTSDNIFQLALNKDGVVRGNYYNALTDSTQPVFGSLDKKSQRVAWSVGEKKDKVFEAGLYNLTLEQTTVLVHTGKDRTDQYRLFRIEQPQEGQAQPGQPAPAQ